MTSRHAMTPAAASLTEQLAQRLQRPVDDAARQRAALLLVDWLGCALAALRYPLARQLRGIVQAQPAGAVVALGTGRRSVADALLLNGALGNVLEMDDVHRGAILHPGPVVIPVALAVAQVEGADAHALLDAVVRGYEATIRVGRALGRGHYRYWHPTSTAGAFGAAAAAASVLRLPADAVADALGNAGSRTGGLWQMRHEPVPTKSLHNAEAARSGWLAAQLALAGVRGPRRILEGEQGLFAATALDAMPDKVVAEEADWLIHSTSLKPWPACRHAHPAIDAMLDALEGLALADIAQIQHVQVRTYAEALRFCDRAQPQTELDAKFSLQHALASILAYGRPQLAHYTDESCSDEDVAHWRERVHLAEDTACSERFPAHYGATVVLHLADGRQLEAARTDACGDPECPMSADEVIAKALALAQWGGVSAGLAQPLFGQVRALSDGGSLDALNTILARVS
ncbi:MmgE/PrpD family protein [Stenotrophomonas sp. SY1]|uniref:MmgE/PrpD family protein n=1 Tax=Stenotrophomonas sp. SY1 TaxID=477235 RepID=UPI001E355FA8|nr:MmgE/PrpD family protein [Stenotrophomonas sp. SY1]MCD9085490.1 MmgE/PrpD family protein [Stenotrophomonas sp. SY1]